MPDGTARPYFVSGNSAHLHLRRKEVIAPCDFAALYNDSIIICAHAGTSSMDKT